VDEIPDSTDMIGKLFRERECLAHQTGTALAKGVVEPFNVTGFAAGYIDRLVAFGGQNAGISLQEIGVAERPLSIFRWERIL
jgi:hypothetical protein